MSTARKLVQFLSTNGGIVHPLSLSEQFICSQLDLLDTRASELESAQLSACVDNELAEAQQTIAHLEATCDLLTQQRDEARAFLSELIGSTRDPRTGQVDASLSTRLQGMLAKR